MLLQSLWRLCQTFLNQSVFLSAQSRSNLGQRQLGMVLNTPEHALSHPDLSSLHLCGRVRGQEHGPVRESLNLVRVDRGRIVGRRSATQQWMPRALLGRRNPPREGRLTPVRIPAYAAARRYGCASEAPHRSRRPGCLMRTRRA